MIAFTKEHWLMSCTGCAIIYGTFFTGGERLEAVPNYYLGTWKQIGWYEQGYGTQYAIDFGELSFNKIEFKSPHRNYNLKM